MGSLLKETPYSEITATMEVFNNLGVTRDHLALLRSDKGYAKKVAHVIRGNDREGLISYREARAILGNNFFGVEEWKMFHGVTFSKRQLRHVEKFPWDETILNSPCPFIKGKKVKETHFAFLGIEKIKGKPLSIMKFHELHPEEKQPRFHSSVEEGGYREEEFANDETCIFTWYLMLCEIVPGSTNKTYKKQLELLPFEYEVPYAIEEVSKDFFSFKKNGLYLNGSHYGYCKDVNSVDCRIIVGIFNDKGLIIGPFVDSTTSGFVGLAASRKIGI